MLETVSLAVDFSVDSQGQPTAAVPAEDVAREQGLSGGVQRERSIFLVLIGTLCHQRLGHVEHILGDGFQWCTRQILKIKL